MLEPWSLRPAQDPRYSRISLFALALVVRSISQPDQIRVRPSSAGVVCRAVRQKQAAAKSQSLSGTAQVAPSPRLLLDYSISTATWESSVRKNASSDEHLATVSARPPQSSRKWQSACPSPPTALSSSEVEACNLEARPSNRVGRWVSFAAPIEPPAKTRAKTLRCFFTLRACSVAGTVVRVLCE